MAPPAGTLRVRRYFLSLLAILAVLYTIVFWPGARHSPKLGLDLQGGTQVIFTAKAPGGKTPSKSSMGQAKQIMEQRVNGTGVTEATVVIQGSNQIVVSIPGGTNTDVAKLGKAAQLSMRGLVMPVVPIACKTPVAGTGTPTPSTSPSTAPSTKASGSASPNGLRERPLTAPTTPSTTAPATPTTSPKVSPSPTKSGATNLPACSHEPFAGLKFAVPTVDTAYEKLSTAQRQELAAALSRADCANATDQADSAPYYYACDNHGTAVYLLGDVIVKGTQISGARAVAPSSQQPAWTVTLDMKGSAQTSWAKYTAAHNIQGLSKNAGDITSCSQATIPCADWVGFVLDGVAISVPVNNTPINQATTEISGTFNSKSAKELANQLKYGALPLSFKAEAAQTVSATLGTSQLKAGLLAGGIGLILVVIYSLLYYRALGLVTIASLLVSGALTYGCLVMLATQIGFTLSLAGIAGFIVAVGITADSFVVFFERIKDEVHDGRSARVAIPRAWVRARRTILSADTVSFLAAAILYYFAAGDVKGFAFTLGLSTVLDLVVVFLFTHPLVSLLSRSRAFGSRRFTGLDQVREGGMVADVEEKPGRQRAVRPAKPAKPAKPVKPEKEKAAVAVLEPEMEEAGEPEPDVEKTPAEPVERRHTTPAAGSAAERAAARRARLRGDDKKGER